MLFLLKSWRFIFTVCALELPRRISRQKFPKRTRILSIPSKPYSFHSVHSAIGSRMNRMIFHSFRKRNSSQKNTNSVYYEYSNSRIVPNNAPLTYGPSRNSWFCFRASPDISLVFISGNNKTRGKTLLLFPEELGQI